VNLAWRFGDELVWACEPEGTYGSLVTPGLDHRSFQASDVTNERGRVVHWSNGSFRHRVGRPILAALQARFRMRAVQSWSLHGELVRGRLFCLDKRQMRLDDLILGEVVARLAVSQLDAMYLLTRLRQTAALEERLRVARDLHDSLLQAVSGTALQLVAARRLLDRNPQAARERLEDVQTQLERGELEMRSFIRRLRPKAPAASGSAKAGLRDRVEELCRRVERQWDVRIKTRFEAPADAWADTLVEELYRIAQEGVLNAARHADASIITLTVKVARDEVTLHIADDGRGFPFVGTYDLAALNAMNQGPLTLKERVGGLRGDLQLRSTESGTELLIRLPVARAA
jgi:signal transduction histidine kinase